MAITAVNIFTQKKMENYEQVAALKETIEDASVATSDSSKNSELQNFIDNEIAHIYGYKDKDALLNVTSGLPSGRSLAGLSCKWINSDAATGPSAKLGSLTSFSTSTVDKIAAGKAAGVEELEERIKTAQKELKEYQAKVKEYQNECDSYPKQKDGETPKKKYKKAYENAYKNLQEYQAKVKSTQSLIAQYQERIEYLSS